MGHLDAIGHEEKHIATGVIQARQAHCLRRVPIFMSTLCHVRQGEKRLQYGEQQWLAGPQQLILMPAGRELSISNHPGSAGYYIADTVSLPAALLRNFRIRLGLQDPAPAAPGRADQLCVPLDGHSADAWNHLLACLATDAPSALRTHYAEGMLLALSLAGHAGPLLSDRHDPLAARVEQLLMHDPARDWSVASVAAQLHLGASTLRRRLDAENSSFRHILEQVRLGLALQNLQGTLRPIGEIASACGYASASRFSARFRQHYGLSPRDLRAAL